MRLPFINLLTLACICLLPRMNNAQNNLNMTLQDSLGFFVVIDSVKYNIGVNDVNGWVDTAGNEYALVGLNTGVSIVDVDSDTIREVVFVPGVNNLWRDINTFGHYAYVTSEARVGLLIIDLQYLPDSVKTYIWKDSIPTPDGGKPFEKAHTIWIDEYGIGYLNGSNLNAGGVVMVDLATHPTDPDFLGFAPAIYSHDVYARDSILYSAEIYLGYVSIYDVHDPQDVKLIGRVSTPTEFTHNAWLSDNSRYMFTTDERSDSYVASYDIQDPANIVELDRFRQAAVEGSGAIPHNVYVWNDWLVVAYYTSGTLIVDASRPDNLVEVGNFDSYLGEDGGFSGVWGSYPFLPSGKILSSDRNSGLYVFVPNYVRAAFLEGIVVDTFTQQAIQGATVTIVTDEILLPQLTKLDGTFKTGKAIPGTFDIVIQKGGYHTKIVTANFINGQVLTPKFELVPLPQFFFSGQVIDMNGIPVPNARVRLFGPEGVYTTETSFSGNFEFAGVYEGPYEIQAGVWGRTTETEIQVDGAEDITLVVQQGYNDDFDLDLGWTIWGDAVEGQWRRGKPIGQELYDIFECGSATDSPFDNGDYYYSTGLTAGNNDAGEDEVSGGTTWLVSPPMDLDSIAIARITFDYWLCEFPPNEYLGLQMWMTNGIDTTWLAEFTNDTIVGSWQNFSIDVANFNGPKDNIQIMFSATDTTTTDDPGYILKAHLDNFKLFDATVSTGDEWVKSRHFIIYPIPTDGEQLYLKSHNGITGQNLTLSFYDLHGRIISSHEVTKTEAEHGINHNLKEGMYFMQWQTNKGESGVEKILIIKK